MLDAEPHTLPFGQASAIALIINELVTNALKHAFPDDMTGTIRVEFRREEADYVLVVADDGVGIPPSPAEPEVREAGSFVHSRPNWVGGCKLLPTRRAEPNTCTCGFPLR